MLKQNIFTTFEEVKDPTEGTGRIADWWSAVNEHAVCRKNVEEYTVELEKFLKWLREMMAKRQQSGS